MDPWLTRRREMYNYFLLFFHSNHPVEVLGKSSRPTLSDITVFQPVRIFMTMAAKPFLLVGTFGISADNYKTRDDLSRYFFSFE